MNRHTHLDTNVLRKSFVLTVYELLLKSYYRNTTRQKQNKTKPTVSQTRITNLYGMKGRSPSDRDGMRTPKTRTFKNHKKKQIKTNFTLTYSLASWPKFVNCFNLFNELNVCARGRLVCAQQQQKTRYHEKKSKNKTHANRKPCIYIVQGKKIISKSYEQYRRPQQQQQQQN